MFIQTALGEANSYEVGAAHTAGVLHAVIDKAHFLKALAHQNALIERRSSIPILTHVMLAAENGCMTLTGTDMEKTLVIRVSAVVHEPGCTTVPAHLFYDIMRKMPEGQPVTLRMTPAASEHASRLVISAGAVTFDLVTLAPDGFPKMHPQELPFALMMPASVLKRLIDDTAFCMSTDEMRVALGGIHWHAHEQQLRAVATDTHRLALSWGVFDEGDLAQFPPVIVGHKAIQVIKKLLDEHESQHVTLSLSTQQMMLTFDHTTFSSRLLEGSFPAYHNAIPKPELTVHTVDLNVKALAHAVSRVGMVHFDKQNVMKLQFSGGNLELSASSDQYGSAIERLPVTYDGVFSIGFLPKYLLDLCAHAKGETLRMHVQNDTLPVLFQDLADSQVAFVMMPVLRT